MGYDAYSYTVFGLAVSQNDITVETKERGCDHKANKNAKFCAECGKPTYIVETEKIVEDTGSPNEIGYFASSSDSREDGILGFLLVRTDSQDTRYYQIPEPSEKMIQKLKKFLEQHSLEYQESELKKYLYTYYSY